MYDADQLTRRYYAIPARIERYPATDPKMRAWALTQMEPVYRAELRAAISPETGVVPSDGAESFPESWKFFRPLRKRF